MEMGLVSFNVGLSAGRTVMAGARSHPIWRPQGMDGWILNLTVSGRGRINRGRSAFTASPGDILLFAPEVPHDYDRDEATGSWTHLWVYFFPRPGWNDWLTWPPAPGGVFRLHIPEGQNRSYFVGRFELLLQRAKGPLPRRYDFALNILEELLLLSDLVNPHSSRGQRDPRIRRALDTLCTRFTEQITIPRLAGECGLSCSRLSHLFKAEVGMTPMQYLERHRIQQARELLIMTGRTISEVAHEVGFRNPFYFSRVFKKHTGKSPRPFRTVSAKGSRAGHSLSSHTRVR